MKIAIDIDGVQYQWFETAMSLLERHWGVYAVYKNRWGVYAVSKNWEKIKEDVEAEFTYGYEAIDWLFTEEAMEAGLFRHGGLVPGAVEAITSLKREGHELVIVTHRPEYAIPDTIAWLNYTWGAHKPYPWSAIHILGNQESKNTINADVLIDDFIDNITTWVDDGRFGIFFMQPWLKLPKKKLDKLHSKYDRLFVAENWYGVMESIRDIETLDG